jgi:fructokinase
MLIGALEAGGTKMVCAVCEEQGIILEQTRIDTTTPEETIPKIIDFFQDKNIQALGIGAFGPVDVNKNSENYGKILDTPKVAWRHFDLLQALKQELQIPMELDTDVNASCLGEVTYGSAKGLKNVLYLTIGTGIGAGIYINGQLHHGILHPEAGHIPLSRHKEDQYSGKCDYHRTCFEGLASGPAIEERYGLKADKLTENPNVWELEAYYIAQALTTYILTLMPERIILGGGVMHQTQLFPLIRKNVLDNLNGYIHVKQLEEIDQYIVEASLEDQQGILGCLKLGLKSIGL